MKKRLIIRQRKDFPACVRQFKQLKGISVGTCIELGRSYMKKHGHSAHAHSHNGDRYRGWICLTKKSQLKEKNTLLHEVAHLIVNKLRSTPNHGKEWRRVVKMIGGTYKSFLTYSKTRTYKDFSHTDPQRTK